jgi:hypothetical protein
MGHPTTPYSCLVVAQWFEVERLLKLRKLRPDSLFKAREGAVPSPIGCRHDGLLSTRDGASIEASWR